MKQRRIAFAYYLEGWSFEKGDKNKLKSTAIRITTSEYDDELHYKNIFCPNCFTNLERTPRKKEISKDNREPYFKHSRAYRHIHCDLKATKPEGKNYDSYEDVMKAIDNEDLSIISGFMQEKPEVKTPPDSEYHETIVEDEDGEPSDMTIGRHRGESISVPSKITTVNGMCRNFDRNLFKYFQINDNKFPYKLIDLLHNIKIVKEPDNEPKLYFGKIKHVTDNGTPPKPHNIRMTFFDSNRTAIDFCLKASIQDQNDHNITKESEGRYVLIYGAVTVSGIGLCINDVAWGEFAILPEKYSHLLDAQ